MSDSHTDVSNVWLSSTSRLKPTIKNASNRLRDRDRCTLRNLVASTFVVSCQEDRDHHWDCDCDFECREEIYEHSSTPVCNNKKESDNNLDSNNSRSTNVNVCTASAYNSQQQQSVVASSTSTIISSTSSCGQNSNSISCTVNVAFCEPNQAKISRPRCDISSQTTCYCHGHSDKDDKEKSELEAIKTASGSDEHIKNCWYRQVGCLFGFNKLDISHTLTPVEDEQILHHRNILEPVLYIQKNGYMTPGPTSSKHCFDEYNNNNNNNDDTQTTSRRNCSLNSTTSNEFSIPPLVCGTPDPVVVVVQPKEPECEKPPPICCNTGTKKSDTQICPDKKFAPIPFEDPCAPFADFQLDPSWNDTTLYEGPVGGRCARCPQCSGTALPPPPEETCTEEDGDPAPGSDSGQCNFDRFLEDNNKEAPCLSSNEKARKCRKAKWDCDPEDKIDYERIGYGKLDDCAVDREAVHLCPTVKGFCPLPFEDPQFEFEDFKVSPKARVIPEGCKDELIDDCACAQEKVEPVVTPYACKEKFADFVKRRNKELEEEHRLQCERDAEYCKNGAEQLRCAELDEEKRKQCEKEEECIRKLQEECLKSEEEKAARCRQAEEERWQRQLDEECACREREKEEMRLRQQVEAECLSRQQEAENLRRKKEEEAWQRHLAEECMRRQEAKQREEECLRRKLEEKRLRCQQEDECLRLKREEERRKQEEECCKLKKLMSNPCLAKKSSESVKCAADSAGDTAQNQSSEECCSCATATQTPPCEVDINNEDLPYCDEVEGPEDSDCDCVVDDSSCCLCPEDPACPCPIDVKCSEACIKKLSDPWLEELCKCRAKLAEINEKLEACQSKSPAPELDDSCGCDGCNLDCNIQGQGQEGKSCAEALQCCRGQVQRQDHKLRSVLFESRKEAFESDKKCDCNNNNDSSEDTECPSKESTEEEETKKKCNFLKTLVSSFKADCAGKFGCESPPVSNNANNCSQNQSPNQVRGNKNESPGKNDSLPRGWSSKEQEVYDRCIEEVMKLDPNYSGNNSSGSQSKFPGCNQPRNKQRTFPMFDQVPTRTPGACAAEGANSGCDPNSLADLTGKWDFWDCVPPTETPPPRPKVPGEARPPPLDPSCKTFSSQEENAGDGDCEEEDEDDYDDCYYCDPDTCPECGRKLDCNGCPLPDDDDEEDDEALCARVKRGEDYGCNGKKFHKDEKGESIYEGGMCLTRAMNWFWHSKDDDSKEFNTGSFRSLGLPTEFTGFGSNKPSEDESADSKFKAKYGGGHSLCETEAFLWKKPPTDCPNAASDNKCGGGKKKG